MGEFIQQLGLDLRDPSLRPIEVGLRIAGVHRRTPDVPCRRLSARRYPSPCTRLSPARTATGPPPGSEIISRRRSCHRNDQMSLRVGDRERFPRSIDVGGVQLLPDSIGTATPRTFAVASPPTDTLSFGVAAAPACVPARAAHRPRSARLSRHVAYGVLSLVPASAPSSLDCRAHTVWRRRCAPALMLL